MQNGRTSLKLKLSTILLLTFLLGCLTPIDLVTERIGDKLVVSGQISTLSDQNTIQLGVTASNNRLPFPIANASVTLFDDGDGSFPYIEDPSRPGTYMLSNVTGVPGKTYHIEILLSNGKAYKSLPEKMTEASLLDSVYYEIVNEDFVDLEGIVTNQPFIKIYTNSVLSTNTTFLRWSVDEAFLLSPTDFPDPFGFVPPPCFIVQNADPQRVALFDDETLSAKIIKRQLVASRIVDWSFLERHYITTYQSSITKESFDYWRKVNILANQVGSIFDSPPAQISGNIINKNDPTEKTLGFFQAANQSYKRFFLLPVDLPFRILNGKCDFDGNYDPNHYPPRCIDCTSTRNSSYERPIWF